MSSGRLWFLITMFYGGGGILYSSAVDDNTNGGLTQFGEFFTVIHCAPKDFKH